MIMETNTQRFSSRLVGFAEQWKNYETRGFNKVIDWSDKENENLTDNQRGHYYEIGADALRIIVKNLITAGADSPNTILDFPCGSGRVTRHLHAMFPDADIGAADLYASHTTFCAKEFGAHAIESQIDLANLDVGQWDLIFCGSLLTHLPVDVFWTAIDFFIKSLKPGGIAIVTLEGRRSIEIQHTKFKLIEDDLFEIAHDAYNQTGFGYVDYNREFLTEKFRAQDSYGLALVRADWLMRGLAARTNIKIISYTEGDWDDHQDAVAFQKRA